MRANSSSDARLNPSTGKATMAVTIVIDDPNSRHIAVTTASNTNSVPASRCLRLSSVETAHAENRSDAERRAEYTRAGFAHVQNSRGCHDDHQIEGADQDELTAGDRQHTERARPAAERLGCIDR